MCLSRPASKRGWTAIQTSLGTSLWASPGTSLRDGCDASISIRRQSQIRRLSTREDRDREDAYRGVRSDEAWNREGVGRTCWWSVMWSRVGAILRDSVDVVSHQACRQLPATFASPFDDSHRYCPTSTSGDISGYRHCLNTTPSDLIRPCLPFLPSLAASSSSPPCSVSLLLSRFIRLA